MKHISVLMQFVLLYVAVSGPAYACPKPPGYGFILYSYLEDRTKFFTTYTNQVGQSLQGTWLNDLPNAAGNDFPFNGMTDNQARLTELGARTPARWRIRNVDGYCSQSDPLHPAGAPDYEDMDLQPSSAQQPHVCVRFRAELTSLVHSDTWVTVSYSSGSVADIPGGSSDPNVPSTTSCWGTGELYDSNGVFIENISPTNVTANSADYNPYGVGNAEFGYLLWINDTSGNGYGQVAAYLP